MEMKNAIKCLIWKQLPLKCVLQFYTSMDQFFTVDTSLAN